MITMYVNFNYYDTLYWKLCIVPITMTLIYTQHNFLFQNKKLKIKYQHVFEKFKESLDLCGKLQDDIVELTKNKKPTAKQHLVDGCAQTDKTARYVCLF